MPEESKQELYQRVGIGTRAGFGKKPALIVIDVQKGFTLDDSPLGGGLDEMIENVNDVVAVAKNKDVPVIYTVVAWRPDAGDGGMILKKIPPLKEFTIGSRWAELDDRVDYNPDKDFFIIKKQFSCFFGTELLNILISHEVDTCILVGDSTSGCVRSTAISSAAHGFYTIVPLECVGDRSQEAHEANLFDINAKFGDVVQKQEVIDYLNGL
jgi:maleamate amidohydrolase